MTNSRLQSKTPMKRKGKKTLAWDKVKRELKPQFERAGITTCELRRKQCTGNYFLTWAHRVKRRFITTDAELSTVVLACVNCHLEIEIMSHAAMKREVDSVIARREVNTVPAPPE